MGANPKQALGLVLFLVGWTLIAAGIAMDGSVMLIVAGLATVGRLGARC